MFLTFVMVVLALLPLIGASLVWAPASGYLFAIGDTGLGIALFLYRRNRPSASGSYGNLRFP